MKITKAMLDTNNRMLRRELDLSLVALEEERGRNAEVDCVIADLRMRAEGAERLLQDESRARHRWEALALSLARTLAEELAAREEWAH